MNRKQIIEAIKALPRNERMALIRDLGTAAAVDADHFSSGRSESTDEYDKILANDEAKAKAQPQSAEQTYAATAAKAITPETMNKETQGGGGEAKPAGDNLKEANKEQGLPENAAPGANAQHS